jgi:hypothetical protein
MGTKQTKQTKPTPPLPDLHLPANITHPLVATVSESAGRLWNKTKDETGRGSPVQVYITGS